MPAIETVSGHYVDPENPVAEDLLIDDMAWALSRTSRFAGHTVTTIPYNNAQHSVFVASMIYQNHNDPHIALYGLLHDTAECYVGDLPSPIKRIASLKEAFKEIEDNLLNMIFMKYVGAVPLDGEWNIVKKYDARACQIEAYTFMRSRGLSPQWGPRQDIGLSELQSFQEPMSAIDSYEMFIEEFDRLKRLTNQ